MTASALPSANFDAAAAPAATLVAVDSPPDQCPSCDAALRGPYCHECGERAVPRHSSIGSFVRGAIGEVSDVDSKTLLTFRTLFSRPGTLTAEYLAGRTGRYLSPFKVYATVFAALMFAYSVYAPLRVTDVGRTMQLDTHPHALDPIRPLLAARHITPAAFLQGWSDLWLTYQNWLQPVNAVLIAALMALLYHRARRPFLDHTVFALHTLAFTFGLSLLLWPVFYVVGLRVSAGYMAVLTFAMAAYAAYFYVAARRVYGGGKARTAAKAVLFVLGYQVALGGIQMLALIAAGIHSYARLS